AGGININTGYVEATGGDSDGGAGGAASITLDTTGAVNIVETAEEETYAIQAFGGEGDTNGGNATITLGDTSTPSSITVTTAGIEADGGEGTNGGNATLALNSTGAIQILGNSFIATFGGEGGTNGGTATTT